YNCHFHHSARLLAGRQYKGVQGSTRSAMGKPLGGRIAARTAVLWERWKDNKRFDCTTRSLQRKE
ncbi:MAG: hypothetical protein WBJ72_04270, partial [Bacillota bacterium]